MIGIRTIAFSAARRLDGWLHDGVRRRRARSAPSGAGWPGGGIAANTIEVPALDVSGIDQGVARHLAGMYLAHRFDLLGSGWVSAGYDGHAYGMGGHRYRMNAGIAAFDRDGQWLRQIMPPAHAAPAAELWRSIGSSYRPIDWQRDFKSGFRWSATTWYKDVDRVPAPGADIKVPWELSRLQHLPQLALFALLLPDLRPALAREFRDQTLDFIASNPAAMGVNWACPMEAAIRAVNLLVADDLFSQIGGSPGGGGEFRDIVARSIRQHGRHIAANLEWLPDFTANHYLANIAGLLFIAAYLPPSDETNGWLAFAVPELLREFGKQFNADGSNFEASTSYHRLSAELIAAATAMLLGIPGDRLPALHGGSAGGDGRKGGDGIALPGWFTQRFHRMTRYTVDLTKPDGSVPQIGDNDSGRFLRLSPNGAMLTARQAVATYRNLGGYPSSDEPYWDEHDLDHRTLSAACFGLTGRADCEAAARAFPLEASLMRSLARGRVLPAPRPETPPGPAQAGNARVSPVRGRCQVWEMKPSRALDEPLTRDLHWHIYPDAGMYIARSDRLYLAISAGPNGQNGVGGHAHNDKLSFELAIDGEDICRDPGTYVYTPLPDERNRFRGTAFHNTAVVDGIEQNRWRPGQRGLFSLINDARVELLESGDRRVSFRLRYRSVEQVRTFEICDQAVRVIDHCNRPFRQNIHQGPYSPGYGKLCNSIFQHEESAGS